VLGEENRSQQEKKKAMLIGTKKGKTRAFYKKIQPKKNLGLNLPSIGVGEDWRAKSEL